MCSLDSQSSSFHPPHLAIICSQGFINAIFLNIVVMFLYKNSTVEYVWRWAKIICECELLMCDDVVSCALH